MRKEKTDGGISEEALLAEYGAVYKYALTICQNETEAQDVTQETFLKAMRSGNGFEGNSSLYTWLCSIAKNLWINKCKKQNRELAVDEWEQNVPDSKKGIERMMAERDSSRQIHRVLHTLDEPYKEVFSLRVFGELPFGDIAELFSKTESWARVTYYRARKMITETLEREGLL